MFRQDENGNVTRIIASFTRVEEIHAHLPEECYDCMLPIARCVSARERQQCPIQVKDKKRYE